MPELPLQRADAHLVLLERGRPPPLPEEESHQGPVHRLLQRVQRQDPPRRLDGRLPSLGANLVAEQPRQPLQGQLVESLPLEGPPFLEGGLVQR